MATQWLYEADDGRIEGPHSAAEMRLFAQAGVIRPGIRVRRSIDERWVDASEVNGLLHQNSPALPSSPQSPGSAPSKAYVPASVSRQVGALLTVLGLFLACMIYATVNKPRESGSYSEADGEQQDFRNNVLASRDSSFGDSVRDRAMTELRHIVERGRNRTLGDDELKDVHVDVLETSSLTYPFVGRIISTWSRKSGRGLRYWIYYKFDGYRWTPTWATPGGIGTIDPLTENEAMREPSDPRMKYPWSSSNSKLWD